MPLMVFSPFMLWKFTKIKLLYEQVTTLLGNLPQGSTGLDMFSNDFVSSTRNGLVVGT
jgi:hypothetical protein